LFGRLISHAACAYLLGCCVCAGIIGLPQTA
jgi:hypothetical protein